MERFFRRLQYQEHVSKVTKRKKQLMFRKMVVTGLLSALLINSVSVFASAAEPQSNEVKDVIVVYKNEAGKQEVLEESVEVDYEYQSIPAVSASLTESDIAKLENNPNIAYVEENKKIKLFDDSVRVQAIDTEAGGNWGIGYVDPDRQVLSAGHDGTGVNVAVLDSGISSHPDLRVVGGYSAVNDGTTPADYNDLHGHGTHVAGIIGASNNGLGVEGVAPDANLYAVKVMNDDGTGDTELLTKGVDWAIANNMDVINMSLGTDGASTVLENLVNIAHSAGIVVVAAAGNDGDVDVDGNGVVDDDSVDSPARYHNAIAVSSIDSNEVISSFSNRGPEIDFAAPGGAILSTYTGGQYATMGGTSMASPHVAGLVAVLLEQNPTFSADEIREELKKHAKDLGSAGVDDLYGYGAIQYGANAEVLNWDLTYYKVKPTLSELKSEFADPLMEVTYFSQPITDDTAVIEDGTEVISQGLRYIINIIDLSTEQYADIPTFTIEHHTGEELTVSDVKTLVLESHPDAVVAVYGPEDKMTPLLDNGLASNGQVITAGYTEYALVLSDIGPSDITPPSEVTGVETVEITDSSVKIHWVEPTDADYLQTNIYNQDGLFVGSIGGGGLSEWLETNLSANTTYTYTLKTEDVNGNESTGVVVTFTTLPVQVVDDTTAPSEVTDVLVSNVTDESFTIDWVNPTDKDYMATVVYLNGAYQNTLTEPGVTFGQANPDTEYTVKLATVDSSGNESVGVTFTVRTLPAPVAEPTPTPYSVPFGYTVEDLIVELSANGFTGVIVKNISGVEVTDVSTVLEDGFTYTFNESTSVFLIDVQDQVIPENPTEPVNPPTDPVIQPEPTTLVVELAEGFDFDVIDLSHWMGMQGYMMYDEIVKDLNGNVVTGSTLIQDGFIVEYGDQRFVVDLVFQPIVNPATETLNLRHGETMTVKEFGESIARGGFQYLTFEIWDEQGNVLGLDEVLRDGLTIVYDYKHVFVLDVVNALAPVEPPPVVVTPPPVVEPTPPPVVGPTPPPVVEPTPPPAVEPTPPPAETPPTDEKDETRKEEQAKLGQKMTEAKKKATEAIDKKINGPLEALNYLPDLTKNVDKLKPGSITNVHAASIIGQYQGLVNEFKNAKIYNNVVFTVSEAVKILTEKKVDNNLLVDFVKTNIKSSQNVQKVIKDLEAENLFVSNDLVDYLETLKQNEPVNNSPFDKKTLENNNKKAANAIDKKINGAKEALNYLPTLTKNVDKLKPGTINDAHAASIIGQYQGLVNEFYRAKSYSNIVVTVTEAVKMLTQKEVEDKQIVEFVKKNISTSKSSQKIIEELKASNVPISKDLINHFNTLLEKETKRKA